MFPLDTGVILCPFCDINNFSNMKPVLIYQIYLQVNFDMSVYHADKTLSPPTIKWVLGDSCKRTSRTNQLASPCLVLSPTDLTAIIVCFLRGVELQIFVLSFMIQLIILPSLNLFGYNRCFLSW